MVTDQDEDAALNFATEYYSTAEPTSIGCYKSKNSDKYLGFKAGLAHERIETEKLRAALNKIISLAEYCATGCMSDDLKQIHKIASEATVK